MFYVGVWERDCVCGSMGERLCMWEYRREIVYVGVWERDRVCGSMGERWEKTKRRERVEIRKRESERESARAHMRAKER